MVVLHISEAELARNVHAVLEEVCRGAEVVIERNNHPFAVIRATPTAVRGISDVIAELEARGSHATLDENFSSDLEEVINSHREPLSAPTLD
jgi:hypothetical protein